MLTILHRLAKTATAYKQVLILILLFLIRIDTP